MLHSFHPRMACEDGWLRLFRPNRAHDDLPLLVVNLQGESFFGPVLDCGLSRRHLVAPKARYYPLQALVRHDLDLKTYQLNLLRICEVSDCLVYNSVRLGPFDHVVALFISVVPLFLHLTDKFLL